MLITLMRYRTGKFGVQAIEETKNHKRVNNDRELLDMKAKFGKRCIEYRIDEKNGVVHVWTFKSITAATLSMEELDIPSMDNDEPEDG